MQHAIAPIEDTRMTTLLRLVSRVSMGTRTICDEVKTVSMDSRGEYERTFCVFMRAANTRDRRIPSCAPAR
jgi:hypothetical protein